jgi:pimeloyl-ACP methyl ester carboxylesterase
MSSRVKKWRRAGEPIGLAGRQLYVHHRDGAGPPLMLLHGYPSSSYDWRHVLELLPERGITCFDFLGFGLSEKPRDHLYSLHGHADAVQAIVERYAREPVLLVAHDMSTSVVTELLAREVDGRLPFELRGVLLFNGSIVIERASLTISQKLLRSRLGPLVARLSSERAFRAQFARIFSEQHPLSAEEAADQWQLLAYNGGHRILDRLTFYLHERVIYAPRWHRALGDWSGALELAWAGRDPVCTEQVLQAVLELRPDTPLSRLPEIGHYPQLEDPLATAEIIEGFASRAGSRR